MRAYRHRILNILQVPFAVLPLAGDRRCAMCGHRVGWFLPYEGGSRHLPPLMRAVEMVGSDVDHFNCPWCRSHDRERHLLLYMRRTGLLAGLAGKAVVHFAPERNLSRIIAAQGPAQYVRCDLFPTEPDIRREDLLATSFEPASVDVVIANHVLEHVSDDRRAVAEIARILRPGGLAILQTPYSPLLETTWEDPGLSSPEARLQAYGQADHVRLFGRDIFARITSQGLVSRVQTHGEVMGDVAASQAGVNVREPLFLFQKPES